MLNVRDYRLIWHRFCLFFFVELRWSILKIEMKVFVDLGTVFRVFLAKKRRKTAIIRLYAAL